MSPLDAAEFRADLGLTMEAVQLAVDPNYAKSKDAHLAIWLQFCTLPLPPGLRPTLSRWQNCPSANIITTKYFSDVLCLIGQAFSILGAPDPRLTALDRGMDFRLQE